jgi:DNA polymerase-4
MTSVKEKLTEVFEIMWMRYLAKKKQARTLTLKVRFSDFSTITRSSTRKDVFTYQETLSTLMDLLPQQEIHEQGVRLLGATLSNFQIEEQKSSQQIEIDFEAE